jgi:membrane protein
MERLDRLRTSVTTRIDQVNTGTAAARERWTAVDAVFATRERDQRVVGGVLAGAVAFRLFAYLLPLCLALLSLLGVAASLGARTAQAIGDQLGLSSYLIDSVDTAVDESKRGLWALVPLALWTTYSTGVGTAKVLRATHALAWGRPLQPLRRSWTGAVASLGFVLVAIAVVSGTQALRERSEGAGLGFVAVQLLILIGLWWVASRLLPHDPGAGWRALLPGALLVGVGVWILHVASVYLLARRVASASALYGSLGVAAAILAWLYLLGRLLVASATLNATLWERRQAAAQATADAA